MPAPTQLRQTHTYVELDLPPEVYDYIAQRMRDAGYNHLLTYEGGGGPIDLSGIAIVPDNQADSSHPIRQRVVAEFLQRTGKYVTNDASRQAAIADAITEDRRARENASPTYTTALPGLSEKEVSDIWESLFSGKYQLRVDYQRFAAQVIEKACAKAGVRLAHPSEERLVAIWQKLGGAEGFLKTFGFLQYARAVEAEIWGEQE